MEAREKPFDVFISHSSADRHAASLIKQHLQSQGLRCWKAPDDIFPGESWPQAILRAIGNSEVMLLVWTGNATTSQEVGKELTLAMRNNLTVVPFRLENVAATGEWEYHLANTHWMDAFDGQLEDHLGSLTAYLQRVIAAKDPEESNGAAITSTSLTMSAETLLEPIDKAKKAETRNRDKSKESKPQHQDTDAGRIDAQSFDLEQIVGWPLFAGIFLSAIVTVETGAHNLPVWLLGPLAITLVIVFAYMTIIVVNFFKTNR